MTAPHRLIAGGVAALVTAPLTALALAAPHAVAADRHGGDRSLARSPELSVSSRLADRRSFVIGDRAYEVSAEDGSYPAAGFHTRGEMGGFWSMPIKLLDGMWFGVDGRWLSARSYSSGWGYARRDLGTASGVSITRTDFAPDGVRATVVGLTLSAPRRTRVHLTMDAHSELMTSYPWGETTPSQLAYNLPDRGAVDRANLVFRETGTPPVANASRHDYAAVVGSTLRPSASALGPDFRGPQDPATVCPASGPNLPPPPARCDDTAYGKGTGGQLTYTVDVPSGGRTVWFAVGGSDNGLADAQAQQRRALHDPQRLLAAKVAARRAVDARTTVDLPGDPLLQSSVTWSKQNLADSVQEAHDLQLRVTSAGTAYPAPIATQPTARWIGAGWPDYPWLFGTDGEYTAFAAVASGQFDSIEAHLRSLRDVSDKVNARSGKVAHEVVPDGSVFFGANSDPGNTDETAKFPSAVALVWRWTGDNRFRDEMYDFAVRNLHYIYRELDADGDGWPEGLGNVERNGMGQEKLDNAVYTDRGLRDLADLAASKGDAATVQWATTRAQQLESKFEADWWFGGDTDQYADSLKDPGNVKVFQRHWIGLTPVEAELVRPGQPAGPLASDEHARLAVAKREEACYSGEFGLFHTGTGATSDPTKPNPGPTCDSAVSTVGSERSVFTLNTSIMAVSEAALGRTDRGQLQRYTTANARVQMDPSVWEAPGSMPEISPSPDFTANIDQKFTDRSSGLQAWGTYGILWPVVHFELGVAPDLGRGAVAVVPQVPTGQQRVAGRDIRLGRGAVDVTAERSAGVLRTTVQRHGSTRLTIGAVLPTGAAPTAVRLDGHPVAFRTVMTARGREVLVDAGRGRGTSRLVVGLA